MSKSTFKQVGVIDDQGTSYLVGDLVTFKSTYQHGTAIVRQFLPFQTVELTGVDVTSIWGQQMVPGNSIMGPVEIITGKVEQGENQ